jgi:kynurenine formamidase
MYDVPPAQALPYRSGEWTGDVKQGGSCNFDTWRLTPHCNGTHTETLGHLTEPRPAIATVLRQPLCTAVLVTVAPVLATVSLETYTPTLDPADQVLTQQNLELALEAALGSPPEAPFPQALVIRLPKTPGEAPWKDYTQTAAAFFTTEAMAYLAELPLSHLIVELPSLDRARDEGLLSNHRLWWGLAPGSTDPTDARYPFRTITELVWVPDELADGHYIVDIQPLSWMAEAAPSRIWLYPELL